MNKLTRSDVFDLAIVANVPKYETLPEELDKKGKPRRVLTFTMKHIVHKGGQKNDNKANWSFIEYRCWDDIADKALTEIHKGMWVHVRGRHAQDRYRKNGVLIYRNWVYVHYFCVDGSRGVGEWKDEDLELPGE